VTLHIECTACAVIQLNHKLLYTCCWIQDIDKNISAPVSNFAAAHNTSKLVLLVLSQYCLAQIDKAQLNFKMGQSQQKYVHNIELTLNN
jgi:hypothetical protein